jgi:hypothetical protein
MLERCDREGVPAYLESSKDENLPFYERHGFAATGTLHLPLGGPPIRKTWRSPGAQQGTDTMPPSLTRN